MFASGRGVKGRPPLPLPKPERQALRWHHTKVFATIALGLAIVIAASSWWFYFRTPPSIAVTRGQIYRIDFVPVPEGARASYALGPRQIGQQPLSQVLDLVPIPLPAPLRQGFWCHPGGLIEITLSDGRVISYGSCRLPDSIRAFRSTIGRRGATLPT